MIKINFKKKHRPVTNSRLGCKNYTLFMTKLAKVDTLFMTTTVKKNTLRVFVGIKRSHTSHSGLPPEERGTSVSPFLKEDPRQRGCIIHITSQTVYLSFPALNDSNRETKAFKLA